jgi:hypothetical protein
MALLSGGSVKLRDDHGAFIGVLIVPSNISTQLDYVKSHERTVRVFKRPLMTAASWSPHDDAMCEIMQAEFFLIVPSYHRSDSFMLAGITPEEINSEPGFAFLPSAEYMRRPTPEKTEDRKPIERGPHLTAARDLAG